VVIGAGVGGLTSAALLAKAGFDVTVLEAHVYPGGCAGTFYHKGFRFDAGATIAGGFQPGGPHEIVGRMLDIRWPVTRVEPAWTVVLPDRTVARFGDGERWLAERVAKIPALERFWGLQEYTADAVWKFAARIPEWPPRDLAGLVRLALKIRPDMVPISPMALASLGQVLDLLGIKDKAARTFIDAQLLISAQVTAEHANGLYGMISMDLPRSGANHVHGGIGGLSKTLADSLVKNGGQILYRQEVSAIEVMNGAATRVHTNRKLTFEADTILANLTPWALNRLLGEASPGSLQKEAASRPSTWGAFTLYLGVPADKLPADSDHFQIVKDYAKPLGEGNSVFVSMSDKDDPTRAPAGYRAITLSTHTHIEPWWALREKDPNAYAARVADYRDRLLEGAEKAIPGLSTAATLVMPGTPHAFEYYTGRLGGMVGGFPQTSLFNARGPRTGIANLWLVGDSVFPGQSTAGVTAGALRVVAEVRRAVQPRRASGAAVVTSPTSGD
jgi:C-3',4' desaturase CrtD